MIRRSEGHFAGRQGHSLFRRSWAPTSDPERAIVLAHGAFEHSGRYEHVGAWLAERGSAVHALDHQGNGRSSGPRNFAERFDHYLDDIETLIELVAEELPGVRRVLLGHSLGGLMATRLAATREPDVSAVVVTGPALALESAGDWRLGVARLLRRILPRLRTDMGLSPELLSRDPEVGRRYVEDPLVDTRISLSLAVEMADAARSTAGAAADVRLPMLFLHGGDDRLCLPAGSEAFVAGLSGDGHRLQIYPELRHEILNEPEYERILADLLEWLRAQESGDRPASREAETA